MFPFHIKRIEIDSMFGTKDICWDILPNVNILGGTNGSGKSSIIKACFSILDNGSIEEHKLIYLISKIRIILVNDTKIEWDKEETEQVNNHKFDKDYEYRSIIYPGNNKGKFILQRTKVTDKDGNKILFDELSKELEVHLINSFEHRLVDTQNVTIDNNDRTYLDYLIHNEIFQRNSVFSGVFETLIETLTKSNMEEIRNIIRQPKVKNFMLLYNMLESFMKEYDVPVNNQIKFKRIGGKEISYTELSMGEKQLVLLFLMVNNTAGRPCIFFMDEPDLGMHVEWKEILIKKMREMNPNMQIILTTHAPSMIEGWFENVKEVTQITKK